MGMCATLIRVTPEHFDHLEAREPFPGEPEEVVDVDKLWESVTYVLGNGNIGDPITGSIFLPHSRVLEEERAEGDFESQRYHTSEEVTAINAMINDLTEERIRNIIQPGKMENVYRFHPDNTDETVQLCLATIQIFENAERHGHVIVTSMG